MDATELQEKRVELREKLEELVRMVVGSASPVAPGVDVELQAAAAWKKLPGSHPIARTYDTIATIRVKDDDAQRAETYANEIAEVLETSSAETDLGYEPQVVSKPRHDAVEARFLLNPA